ncbi:flagellar hook-length control protein FliK, partial [Parasphingorhabdus sp.]|uniref:flagellar hook-length control protein FliK n=1 Tax=Parasphingorhabdus sp. TaxID=2709688 RepID=UPI002F94CD51
DMEASSQWIAKLSQDIGNLSAEKPVLNFQLKPEHLGKLSVRITAGTAGDVVRLETENENVKALLIGAQGRLEQDIRLSGLKLSRVDVTVQDHPGSQLGQQGSGSRESGTETGRNGDARPQEYTAQQSSLRQHGPDVAAANGPAATSSYHGARYA